MAFRLRPDVKEALVKLNYQLSGRGISSDKIEDPLLISRIETMRLPGEDMNDTVLRLIEFYGHSMH